MYGMFTTGVHLEFLWDSKFKKLNYFFLYDEI